MLIAPLSLSNFVTVAAAGLCIWSAAPQLRGAAFPVWRLAVPAGIATLQACMLLASVFDVTLGTDAEWLFAVLAGGLLGRHMGWSVDLEVDQDGRALRQRSGWDVVAVLGLLAMAAAMDFVAAAQHAPWLLPADVAAMAAFGAAYLAFRALAMGTRAMAARGDLPSLRGVRDRRPR